MQGFLWKLPVLRGLSPVRKGFAEGIAAIAVGSVFGAFGLAYVASRPTEGLLRSLAEIGATLLIAYAIEVSWIVRASSNSRALDERESRLGAFIGIGAAALTGIALALGLAERASVHHLIFLDEIAFGWVAVSFVALGAVVVLQPLFTHEWLDDDARVSTGREKHLS
jgi:uncharacterized membrane protein HdeD (DUF308 family)